MKKTITVCVMMLAAVCGFGDDPFIARAASAWNKRDGDAVIAAAARESPASVPLVTGIVRHNLAVEDPGKWVDAAIVSLAACAKSGDPVAMAYHGSALTIRAGLKFMTEDFMGATADLEAGFALMDKAVQKAPDSLLLRRMRGENAASTSEQSPFDRWDVAAQDAAFLEARADSLSRADLSFLEFLKARIALGAGDAEEGIRRLEAAIRLDPESPEAEAARAMLSDLEE